MRNLKGMIPAPTSILAVDIITDIHTGMDIRIITISRTSPTKNKGKRRTHQVHQTIMTTMLSTSLVNSVSIRHRTPQWFGRMASLSGGSRLR